MTTVKMSSKNQIVVPKEAREQLGIRPGDELLVVPKGDRLLVLVKPKDLLEELRGSGKGIYGDVDQYLKRERQSWRKKPLPGR